MKRLPALFFYTLACITIYASCTKHNIDISYREDHHYYSMKANFSNSKMREVEKYMDDRIGRTSNMSFVNARIDGTLALNDHTTFYIKKSTGRLEIKLNKDKNSDRSYREIKSMCQGLKTVIVK